MYPVSYTHLDVYKRQLYDMADKGWIDYDVVSNIDKCFADEADIL